MLSLGEIHALVPGSRMVGEASTRFTGLSTDSRNVADGEAFVAVVGDVFDGHEFLDDVVARGASALIVAHEVEAAIPQLVVADTRAALGHIARGWRCRFSVPLIAVVGSNGKTTTKEMIAAIFCQAFGAEHYLATAGNFNNDIGLPLTLLRLRSAHRAAVVEIGMNHPGETAWLAGMALPTIVLVTNAQREHQEFMQSVEAVAHEHALAVAGLEDTGTAVFPADDAHAGVWRAAAKRAGLLEFSLDKDGQGLASGVRAVAHLGLFESVVHLSTPIGALSARIATAGEHNVRNATAAAAAAVASGISANDIRLGLEAFVPVAGRMRRGATAGGALLIDDTYNANPDSVRAAIEALALAPSPRTLVLGDMGEVGSQGEDFHREVGAYAKAHTIDAFIGVGVLMQHAVDSFGDGATHCANLGDLLENGADALRAATSGAILVKGSRFMQMERLVHSVSLATNAVPDREAH